ncbi:MAG: pirin family protein [Dermatophilus congolensis]|nr:pirin family protein [Dermatophilus congolensis]
MSAVTVLDPREVPLGGLRAMKVRRTLPHKDISLIGAWCFVDHYGPTRVGVDGPGMDVAPHPHTGLQTVSWLFEGTIEHRDSGGVHGLVRPGEMNLMTGGSGICHSEVTTPETTVLHGVQLWLALPDSARHAPRDFDHYEPTPAELPTVAGQATARVFIGQLPALPEAASPVVVHTPLLGAELVLAPGTALSLDLDPSFEHGILLDTGSLTLACDDGRATPVAEAELAVIDSGATSLGLTAGPDGARALLLGGTPFEEEIIMWWNFVGRTSDEIKAFRDEWEAGAERFGHVEGYVGERDRIPAPALPGVKLRSRRRRR